MKYFYFSDLSSRGKLPRASTSNLLPSLAIAAADNLNEAKRRLHALGLRAGKPRKATAKEVRVLQDMGATVAWNTADMEEGEWLYDMTVDEYVEGRSSAVAVQDETGAGGTSVHQ
ncbi:hypothetical protein L1785_03340 [Antribacter sp. KLBMP9083]|uniref:Uncharacterized protein n=1 Tax=Antribacter soli TaxID=2910976 RepID=A0AA41QAR6_9MICO|nr:hypothetical protein [Antribacter soli]MCF4120004.1 hypothetical protein [Antribacter soli]